MEEYCVFIVACAEIYGFRINGRARSVEKADFQRTQVGVVVLGREADGDDAVFSYVELRRSEAALLLAGAEADAILGGFYAGVAGGGPSVVFIGEIGGERELVGDVAVFLYFDCICGVVGVAGEPMQGNRCG